MQEEHSLDAAATAALDAAVADMGCDVCIWSVSLAIDEIAADLATDAEEQERLWASSSATVGRGRIRKTVPVGAVV